ncbi:hypothetical protein CTI12_AA323970 [Artemisia annua]|uniref:Replication factor A C-terminal domain-containing protein n=1 Tax=Artemisia annua TaxID=35608 RepID=A0A2U1N006_ARTAN|nr:hypothetical protein CTI12_AA323970 [Artemisia annua]
MADKGKEPMTPGTQTEIHKPQSEILQRSKDKGKAPAVEPEKVNLMDLKPADLDKPLELKVYRKWTSKNVPDPNPTGLCFILLGRDGSAIQANVQLWDMRQFDTKLQVGSCYRIERYGCKKTDNWQRTLNNPLTLLFGRYTQATPIEEEGFPDHYFNFAAYNELGQRADTRDYTITGGLQLSATPATHYYLNPPVLAANHIRQVYDEMMVPAPPLQLPALDIQPMEQPLGRQITPLNVLMQASPESLVQQFTTEAVITGIDEAMGWYFNRCRTCGNKITEIMPHRHCQQPGIQPAPNYRITITDATGSVLVTCFSPEADSLLPSSVGEMLSYIPDPDPYAFPDIIQDLENTSHIFHVHLAKGSRRGFPRFILDGAQDIPAPALPEIPSETEEGGSYATAETIAETSVAAEIASGSQTPPPGPHSDELPETETPVVTDVVTEIGSSSQTPPPLVETETPVVTEIGSGSQTPPPAPHSDEPAKIVTGTPEIHSTTVRRELFQETEEKSPTRAPKKPKVD